MILSTEYVCPACDGTGERLGMINNEGEGIIVTCSYCKGTGEELVTISKREYHDLQGYRFMYEQCQH